MFVVEQYLVLLWIKFLWLELVLHVKVGKVTSFVGIQIIPSTMKTTNILPHENNPLYAVVH